MSRKVGLAFEQQWESRLANAQRPVMISSFREFLLARCRDEHLAQREIISAPRVHGRPPGAIPVAGQRDS
jgi:hypothetical protein